MGMNKSSLVGPHRKNTASKDSSLLLRRILEMSCGFSKSGLILEKTSYSMHRAYKAPSVQRANVAIAIDHLIHVAGLVTRATHLLPCHRDRAQVTEGRSGVVPQTLSLYVDTDLAKYWVRLYATSVMSRAIRLPNAQRQTREKRKPSHFNRQ